MIAVQPKIAMRNSPEEALVADNVVDRLLAVSFWTIFLLYSGVILFHSWWLETSYTEGWCYIPDSERYIQYPNPDAKPSDACYLFRTPYLLGLNHFECDFARRCIASIVYGAIIGYERKAADRPAGIRTMALVCLGACLFTMCGQFAFRSSPQTSDAARVSAAVPSGVGFLGSALIWKETVNKGTDEEKHEVHGLTTAASVWLAASVGIGAGGELFLYCTYCVVLVVFILRLGPRTLTGPFGGDFGSEMYDTGSDWASEPDDEGTTKRDDDDDDIQPLTRQQQLAQLRLDAAAAKDLESKGGDGASTVTGDAASVAGSLTSSKRLRLHAGGTPSRRKVVSKVSFHG